MTDTIPPEMLDSIVTTTKTAKDFAPPEPGAAYLNALQALALAEMAPTDTDPPLGQPIRILLAAQKVIIEQDALANTAPVFLNHKHVSLILEVMLHVQRLKDTKDIPQAFEEIGKITELLDNMAMLDVNNQFRRREEDPAWTTAQLDSWWFDVIKNSFTP